MVTKNVKVGYRTVKAHYDANLKYAPYAQCGVIFLENGITFMSYVTPVINIVNDILYCDGTYSATTRKQIGRFLKEYAPNLNYYDVKAVAGKLLGINILTKEIVEI